MSLLVARGKCQAAEVTASQTENLPHSAPSLDSPQSARIFLRWGRFCSLLLKLMTALLSEEHRAGTMPRYITDSWWNFVQSEKSSM